MFRSATSSSKVISIRTLHNGKIQVSAADIFSFPPETKLNDDSDRKLGQKLRGSGLVHHENILTKRFLEAGDDDGSRIDIMCLYTRQALCNEAVNEDSCDVEMYRNVMDAKCDLAVSETVRYF